MSVQLSEREREEPLSERKPHGERGKRPTERCGEAPQLSEREGEEPHSEMKTHGKMVKSPTQMWVGPTVE